MRHIRFLLMIALAAVAGAVAGRIAAEVRRQQESGDPVDISLSDVRIRAQDIVPGLVAAARVRDTPWSWLHIPSWLAAFGVNFSVGAVGGDLSRIREMAERAALSFAGIELDLDDLGGAGSAGDDEDDDDAPRDYAPRSTGSATWTGPGPTARRDPPTGFTAFGE